MKKNGWVLSFILIIKLIIVLSIFNKPYNFQEAEKVTISVAKGMSDVRDIKPWVLPEEFQIDHKPINKPFFRSTDWDHFNTIDQVIKANALDGGNAIGYNIIIHYWVNLFGVQGKSLHFFHLIFILLGIIYSIKIAKLFTSNPWIIGLLVVLLTFNPFNQYHEFNLRAYNIVITFVIMQLFYFFRMIKNKDHVLWKDFIAFLILAILMVFSHYLSLGIIGLQMAVLLFYFFKNKTFVIANIVSGIVLLFSFSLWFSYVGKTSGGLGEMYVTYKLINTFMPDNDFFFKYVTLKDLIMSVPQNLLYFFGIGLQDFEGFRYRHFFIFFLPFAYTLFLSYKNRNKNSIFLWITLGFLVLIQIFMLALAVYQNACSTLKPIYQVIFYPLGPLVLFFIVLHLQKLKKLNQIILLAIPLGSMVYFTYLVNTKKFKPRTATLELNELIQEISPQLNSKDTILYSNWDDAHFANFFISNNQVVQKVDTRLSAHNKLLIRSSEGEMEYNYIPAPKSFENMVDKDWMNKIRKENPHLRD
ncbi:MAG: hypothetical protein N4A45_05745 [Flavobacteriales bacterium]|jgi:hypothetical protein|nr:hypothetical protein [Flavobacteriales bacterium]